MTGKKTIFQYVFPITSLFSLQTPFFRFFKAIKARFSGSTWPYLYWHFLNRWLQRTGLRLTAINFSLDLFLKETNEEKDSNSNPGKGTTKCFVKKCFKSLTFWYLSKRLKVLSTFAYLKDVKIMKNTFTL